MKLETKNKLIWVLCVPALVLLFGAGSIALAATLIGNFATKEYVSTHFIKKTDADNLYFPKAEGMVSIAIADEFKEQFRNQREDTKMIVGLMVRIDKKFQDHIVDHRKILSELKKEPPRDPPKPVRIAGGE